MSSMSLYLVLNSSNERHSSYLLGRFYSGEYTLLEPLLCLRYMESSLYHQFFLGKKKVRHSFESRQTEEWSPYALELVLLLLEVLAVTICPALRILSKLRQSLLLTCPSCATGLFCHIVLDLRRHVESHHHG